MAPAGSVQVHTERLHLKICSPGLTEICGSPSRVKITRPCPTVVLNHRLTSVFLAQVPRCFLSNPNRAFLFLFEITWFQESSAGPKPHPLLNLSNFCNQSITHPLISISLSSQTSLQFGPRERDGLAKVPDPRPCRASAWRVRHPCHFTSFLSKPGLHLQCQSLVHLLHLHRLVLDFGPDVDLDTSNRVFHPGTSRD